MEEPVVDRVRNQLIAMIDRALGDDPKSALIASRELKDEIEWLTERSVALARREGYEWSHISRLLGISRQWARERFKAAPPDCRRTSLRTIAISVRFARPSRQCSKSDDRVDDRTTMTRSRGEPQPSLGRPFFRLRMPWAILRSFSISAKRANPSPPGPKPTPGDKATSQSRTSSEQNSTEFISE